MEDFAASTRRANYHSCNDRSQSKVLDGLRIVNQQVSLVKTIKFFVGRGNFVITIYNTLSTFIVERDRRTAAQEVLFVKEARHAILSKNMAMWAIING